MCIRDSHNVVGAVCEAHPNATSPATRSTAASNLRKWGSSVGPLCPRGCWGGRRGLPWALLNA
eukprot:5594910-Pyramimonas_sp.AAC.1